MGQRSQVGRRAAGDHGAVVQGAEPEESQLASDRCREALELVSGLMTCVPSSIAYAG